MHSVIPETMTPETECFLFLVDQLVPGAVGALLGGGPAVADGGVHLLQGVEADLLQDVGEHLLGGEHPDGEA